jgi:hypothetical protein
MDASVDLPGRWQYGIHEGAAGATVRSMDRVELELGDALRVELTGIGEDEDLVHLQYFIATEMGGWALWTSCPSAEVDEHEQAIATLTAIPAGPS